MHKSVVTWFTVVVGVMHVLTVVGDDESASGSSCWRQLIAGHYEGYVCRLTEAGLSSVPINTTALRMVSTGTQPDERLNFTLPRLLQLKVLEYEVTRNRGLPKRPFVHLTGLEKLQLFHVTHSADDFRFRMKAGIFGGLQNVRHLILSDLGLEDLPLGIFNGLQKLRILELNHNRLSQIPLGTFSGCCRELSILTLSRNLISDLGSGSLQGLSALRQLDLSSNKISALNNFTFTGLSAVTTIDLTRNALQDIGALTFNGLNKLRELNLNDNQLNTRVDESAGSSSGGINRESFQGLSSLETLEMRLNNITCVDPSIFTGLNSLKRLDLSENLIQFLPDNSFDRLPKLTELGLGHNGLRTIKQQFSSIFEKLNWIDVSFNPWHCDCNLFWMIKWINNSRLETDESYSEADNLEVNKLENTYCSTPISGLPLMQAYKDKTEECTQAQATATDEPTNGFGKTKQFTSSQQETTRCQFTVNSDTEQLTADSRTDESTTTVDDSLGRNRFIETGEPPADVTALSDGPISTEPSPLKTPESTEIPPFHSLTEDIITFVTPSTTRFSERQHLKTSDTALGNEIQTFSNLLSSVTNNMKTFDSLLSKTNENIRTLNLVLTTTIHDIMESNRHFKNSPSNTPEAVNSGNKSTNVRIQWRTVLYLPMLLILSSILNGME